MGCGHSIFYSNDSQCVVKVQMESLNFKNNTWKTINPGETNKWVRSSDTMTKIVWYDGNKKHQKKPEGIHEKKVRQPPPPSEAIPKKINWNVNSRQEQILEDHYYGNKLKNTPQMNPDNYPQKKPKKKKSNNRNPPNSINNRNKQYVINPNI